MSPDETDIVVTLLIAVAAIVITFAVLRTPAVSRTGRALLRVPHVEYDTSVGVGRCERRNRQFEVGAAVDGRQPHALRAAAVRRTPRADSPRPACW